MGKIEKGEEQLATRMVEHISTEIHRNAKRMRARNRQLMTKIEERPGAEVYLPDLERIKDDIEEIEGREGLGSEK